MLVRWGCERADKAGAISVLQASAAGLELYRKNDFEVVETNEFDLRPFGVDVIDTRWFMIRQPQPPKP